MATEMGPGQNTMKTEKEKMNLIILRENLMGFNHTGMKMGIK